LSQLRVIVVLMALPALHMHALVIIWGSFGNHLRVKLANLELKPTRMTYSFFCLLLCGETTAGSQ
jgi:hypothetical protein